MTRVYRQSFGSRLFDVGNIILIFAIAVSALYPFVYMAAISTSDFFAVGFGKVTLIPVDFSLEIYTYLFQYNPFIARAYYNSILYTVLNTVLTVILCGMGRLRARTAQAGVPWLHRRRGCWCRCSSAAG